MNKYPGLHDKSWLEVGREPRDRLFKWGMQWSYEPPSKQWTLAQMWAILSSVFLVPAPFVYNSDTLALLILFGAVAIMVSGVYTKVAIDKTRESIWSHYCDNAPDYGTYVTQTQMLEGYNPPSTKL